MHLTHQRGFSMIEVLVAIVISAVALLALAGVNAASIRYTKMSQYRATATQLANDMGERMRANKGNPSAGAQVATGFLQAPMTSTLTLPDRPRARSCRRNCVPRH